MKKDQFQIIYNAINLRVGLCRIKLDNISSVEDLQKLTLRDAQELRDFCIKEEAIMTKVCQTDLYHIIGMGDLTPPQMMQFCFAVRDYLQYRSTVKTLAFNFNSISSLPNIPTESTYSLTALAPITLGTVVDGIELARNWELSLVSKEISFTLDKLEDFTEDLRRIFNTTSYSAKTLLNKIKNGGEYAGIKWQLKEDTAHGKVKQNNVWEKIRAGYTKKP